MTPEPFPDTAHELDVSQRRILQLEAALMRARTNDRTTVIALQTDPYAWTEGGMFWEVGVPEVSDRIDVREAKASMIAGKINQRKGI